MVSILLNLSSLCAEIALNFYIAYLMVKLCTPEDLAKQRRLLTKFDHHLQDSSDSELFLSES